MLVSHSDRNFINSVVDHVLSIEKKTFYYIKQFATMMIKKKKNDDFGQYQNNKLKKEIKRLKDVSTTVADWSQENETHDVIS